MEKTDITIIGAGVVGLAIAHKISISRKDIVVIERHDSFGQEASSRNSEVVHAGIYYPKDSLKAKLCIEGKELIYDFCREYNIAHKKLGKLIVATSDEEIAELKDLVRQANENGVYDLKVLTEQEAKKIEPHIKGVGWVYSPSTGIVDTHSFMKRLEFLAEEKSAVFAYNNEVTAIKKKSNRDYEVEVVDSSGEKTTLFSEIVINCAGLLSDRIAQMVGIDIDKYKYRLHYSKGEYFRIRANKANLVSHLIYPTPEAESLGIHIVIDLNGQLKLGPNAFYVDAINYDVDPSHRKEFYQTAKRYVDFISEDDLTPDNSGIRPKLQGPGEPVSDFIIADEGDKGLPGFINLIGIESPGFTASLSIAKYVASMI